MSFGWLSNRKTLLLVSNCFALHWAKPQCKSREKSSSPNLLNINNSNLRFWLVQPWGWGPLFEQSRGAENHFSTILANGRHLTRGGQQSRDALTCGYVSTDHEQESGYFRGKLFSELFSRVLLLCPNSVHHLVTKWQTFVDSNRRPDSEELSPYTSIMKTWL